MQHYGCQDLLQELDHLQNLCKMLPDSPVAASMASTFCTKLKSYQSRSSESICQLLGKAQASSIPESMKSGILETIQNLSTSQGSHLKLVNSGQTVPHLPPYLTHSDWTALSTYQTQTDQLQVLAKRMKAMGVQSLKEATKAQAVAVMLMVQAGQGKPCLSPDSINAAVNDFAVIFQALPPSTCPGAATYPPNPNEMGEVWLRKAYPSEKPLGQEPCMAPWLKKALGLHQEHALQAHVGFVF